MPACRLTLHGLPPLHPGATSPLSLSKALGSAALLEAILPRPLLPSVSVALAGGLDRGAGRHPRLLPAPSPLRPAPGPGPTETSGGGSIESGTGPLAGLAGPESVFGGPRISCLSGNSPEA